MLEGLDYPIERTDGYFDEQTETAVREFQEDHDLDETGQLDEATAQKKFKKKYRRTLETLRMMHN